MTASEKLRALIAAAQPPPHGEDTWEEKMAWDRYNEARFKLERLMEQENALPQIVAVVEAAEEMSTEGRRGRKLHAALAALDEALS